MTVEIRPATIRDATWIAANMRSEDVREILATANVGSLTEAAIACVVTSPDYAWCAYHRAEPAGCFGVSHVSPLQPHLRSAWAWGTDRFKRVAPAITRFSVREWPRRLIADGVTRVEVRSIEGHDIAHKWLSAIRARHEADMPNYGVNGETFQLWSWLKEDWQDVLPKDASGSGKADAAKE